MLTKTYVKSRKVSKVTFELDEGQIPEGVQVESVALVGDFNDWDPGANPMDYLKRGAFKTSVDLEPGKRYQFRYLINGEVWVNDWEADDYVPSGEGSENCVVATPEAE